jgi:hypothetical protein
MPPEVCLCNREMYVPVAFGTVPDIRIVCVSQTIPRLRAPKCKLAGDARLVIPVFSVLD